MPAALFKIRRPHARSAIARGRLCHYIASGRAGSPLPAKGVACQRRRARSDAPYLPAAHVKLGKTAPKCRQKGLVRHPQIVPRAGACCRMPGQRTLEQPGLYPDAVSNVSPPTPKYS